jgi:hypothetical protein
MALIREFRLAQNIALTSHKFSRKLLGIVLKSGRLDHVHKQYQRTKSLGCKFNSGRSVYAATGGLS